MYKTIAVVLNGGIENDARVIKAINSLCVIAEIDLFYTYKYNLEDKSVFSKKNINIHYIPYPNSIYQKLLRHSFFYKEFDFFLPVILKRAIKYNLVYCNDLPTLNIGIKLKEIYNSSLLYDSHEIYVETINQFFLPSKNPIKQGVFRILVKLMKLIGRKYEQKAIKRTDHMLTVNESLKNYFIEKYSVQRISYILNTPLLKTKIDKKWKRDVRIFENCNKGDIIFLYQGFFNPGRGLDLLIKSFRSVKNDKAKLIMIGDGISMGRLKTIVKNNRLENKIFFLGFVSNSELHQFTENAHWGVFFLEEFNISTSLASPNKIFQYIHAEIPVLTNHSIENDKIFNEFQIGIQTSLTEKDIAKNIDKICIANNRDHFISNCQRAKERYNWEKEEEKLLTIVRNLI